MEINDLSGISSYQASTDRYKTMRYRRAGKSGVMLPEVSLGLWHNFGDADNLLESRKVLRRAFDLGLYHFDLANNYGPPFGSAEINFGKILKQDFGAYRDELFISSKAGYDMWPGPFGNFGSRKYLVSSCDQSLKRMGLSYVDIFYHHRPDPDTPIEETMAALDFIVRSGRALYIGLSNYSPEETIAAVKELKRLGTPCLLHQPKYSMFDRWIEKGLLDVLEENGIGSVTFSPLAQGLLTNKYINGVPADSRIARSMTYLNKADLESKLPIIKELHGIASNRGQTLSQMAIAWILRHQSVTSVLIGASSVSQLEENLKVVSSEPLNQDEVNSIEKVLESIDG